MGLKLMEQMRFGDDQEDNRSTLLDQYERLSFEVQLNQAILLGRSLSESSSSTFAAAAAATRTSTRMTSSAPIPIFPPPQKKQAHPTSSFIHKLVHKLSLFRPKKSASSSGSTTQQGILNPNKLWKTSFSRSLRRI